LQRGNLQSSRSTRRAREAGAPLSFAFRYGDCFARFRGVGYGMFFAFARNVCDCALDEVVAPVGVGKRPDGHQAALYRAARRRSFLRLGTEDYFYSPGIRAAIELRWTGVLPLAELCAVSLDFGGGDREAAAWTVARMAGRKSARRVLLEFAGGADSGAHA